VRTLTIVSDLFLPLAEHERTGLGRPDLPFLVVPHSTAYPGRGDQDVLEDALRDGTAVADELAKPRSELATQGADAPSARIEYGIEQGSMELLTMNDELEVSATFYERGWTDGLPIVAPTPERVGAALSGTSLSGDHVLGNMPTRWRPATVLEVAINAVMAGCSPEHLPVLIAAVEASLDPDFNLFGVQGTTNPIGVMILVNGPIAEMLDVNSGYNLFGPRTRASAAIGRALRFCLVNIGGGVPGQGDMSTLGNPNKFGSCIAEAEAVSPWSPFHVDRGFSRQDSAVSVIAAAAPQNVLTPPRPEDVLDSLAGALISPGSNCLVFDMEPMVVISPQVVDILVESGETKESVRTYLYEHTKMPLRALPPGRDWDARHWKERSLRAEGGEEMLYLVGSPDEIAVVVAGGPGGPHAAVVPTFNGTKIVTRKIEV
jgi:hypothetical protein